MRQLLEAGLLEPAPVRTGESGALEKPYRAKARSWWLDDPPNTEADAAFAPIETVQDELRAAGPDSVRIFLRFAVHLSAEDLVERYVSTDAERSEEPAYGGMVVVHRLAE